MYVSDKSSRNYDGKTRRGAVGGNAVFPQLSMCNTMEAYF